MAVFLLFVFGFYFIFILALMYGWEKTIVESIPSASIFHPISVIVPFRNEEKNIERLMLSLLSLDYPNDKIQIILVNDHSSDQSVELAEKFRTSKIQIISLPPRETGKKKAITKGIELSMAQIIVTTDADCVHHPDWLNSINAYFTNPQIKMVVGPVAIHQTNSLLAKLQAIEFSSLIGSGAALLHWDIPAMANGANLAFSREVFYQLGGYEGNEHIASGDDEFLLKKFFKEYPQGTAFNNQARTVVSTLPQPTLGAFLSQRFRWASKWKYQTNAKVKVLAMGVFLFQMSFMAAFFLAIVRHQSWAALLLLAKVGLEGIFLFRVSQFLGVRYSILHYALLQFVYPIYVVVTAVLSLLLSPAWKDRKI